MKACWVFSLVVVFAAWAAADPPAHSEWRVTFYDEFLGNGLNRLKWLDRYQWGRTHNYDAYVAPEHVIVEDGLLSLKADNAPREGKKLTSAAITSYDRFSQQYGYFEGRFRIPKGKGFWPAFWMLPYPQRWPPEIDIFEFIRDEPVAYMTFHWGEPHKSKGFTFKGPDYWNEFHVFGIEWDAEKIVWYIDGVERGRFAEKEAIPTTPMYMLINFGIDARWPGPVDETTPFPAYFECDWVRVYERVNG